MIKRLKITHVCTLVMIVLVTLLESKDVGRWTFIIVLIGMTILTVARYDQNTEGYIFK